MSFPAGLLAEDPAVPEIEQRSTQPHTLEPHPREATSARELAVSADALVWAPADVARVSFEISASGPNYTEATNLLRRKGDSVAKKLQDVAGVAVKIAERNLTVAGVGNNLGRSPAATPGVRVTQQLRVELTELGKLGEILDAGLAAGADRISEVKPVVSNGQPARLQAITSATEKARAQAERAATSLGAKLGRIIDITVTEEETETAARRLEQAGLEQPTANDLELRLFVALRFELL